MKPYMATYYCSYPLLMMAVTMLCAGVLYRARKLVDSIWINRLLIASLFLVSSGYLAITLMTDENYPNPARLIDMTLLKLGFGMILLGVVFSFDLLVLGVWRKGGRQRQARASELI